MVNSNPALLGSGAAVALGVSEPPAHSIPMSNLGVLQGAQICSDPLPLSNPQLFANGLNGQNLSSWAQVTN